MTAKGHLTALLRVLVGAEAVWLECPPDRIGVVERTLVHYKVATPVRFAARPTAVLAVLGPEARGVLGRAGCEVPELAADDHREAELAGHPARVIRAGDLPADGLALHCDLEAADAVWSALLAAGATPVGRQALDALRVEAGRPWYGPDVTEENLLHETGLLRECHSPTKGCYVGQEVVARLEARGGHVNKKLCGLQLGAPATAGARVTAGEEDVGWVTTAAVSPRLGPVALGYLRRGHFDPGTVVAVAGAPAVVAGIPFEERR
jgi:folate-binding protein YgfZ